MRGNKIGTLPTKSKVYIQIWEYVTFTLVKIPDNLPIEVGMKITEIKVPMFEWHEQLTTLN